MKILVNALFLRAKVAGGTETYVTNIVRPWYHDRCGNDEILLLVNHVPDWWEGDRPWFRLRQIRTAGSPWFRILYEQFALVLESRKWDVLFSPGYVGILGAFCPQVITVHDAFAWVVPMETGKMRTLYWRLMVERSMRRATAVIAVSESTRQDLIRFTNVNPAKVRVILEAGDHVPEPVNFSPDALTSGGPSYFLAVGFFKLVKNPERTLAAYAEYRRALHVRGIAPCSLKLVGAMGGGHAKSLHRIAVQVEGVEVLGRVDDARLYWLLQRAYGLIFASLYEGFGLPILEAQRVGCPVLTSRVGSMREVAGRGAILVEPRNEDSIRDGMIELHRSERRRELIQLGKENVARFSWGRASELTLSLLRSAASLGRAKSR